MPSTVAAMNATARSIQAYDTHVATPSGLDGPHQLTSAYDLALIGRADLARADFRKYTAQKIGTIPAQGTKYHAFQFANDNKLLYNYPGAFGGKNGFTDAAHHSFIGAAKHGNRRLIVTMMYGEHKPDNISFQAGRLLDWGFALPRTAAPVGTLVSPVRRAPRRQPPRRRRVRRPPRPPRPDTAGSGSPTSAIALLGAAALAVLLAGWPPGYCAAGPDPPRPAGPGSERRLGGRRPRTAAPARRTRPARRGCRASRARPGARPSRRPC